MSKTRRRVPTHRREDQEAERVLRERVLESMKKYVDRDGEILDGLDAQLRFAARGTIKLETLAAINGMMGS